MQCSLLVTARSLYDRMKADSKHFGLLATVLPLGLLAAIAEWRPAYFANLDILGGLLLLQVVIVTVWHYEKWFFTVMMLSFLWAGTDLPLSGVGTKSRWVFLGLGALVGIVKWAERDNRQRFTAIHLVALLCVLSAVVSSMVSRRMELSLLKSGSFFLLFTYVTCGARVAVAGRERAFFTGLVTACEVIAYLSALFYWVFHFEVFGNLNSLGAVMGVVVVPVLLWAVLCAEERGVRHRLALALCLAGGLLYSSIARAGILACAAAVIIMCISLRRHDLLIKGAFALTFLVAVTAVVQPQKFDSLAASFTEDVIYKGKRDQGVLGSRESPWQETIDVIKENPWFGSGFGADLAQRPPVPGLVFSTSAGQVREHGNSYLAILEYVGLLGITPFLILLGLILREIYRGCSRMWRTRDVRSFTVPLVLVCLSGLIHAIFEDWLFAVGFYLNVFFWTAVFVLAELQSTRLPETVNIRPAWGEFAMPARPVPVSSTR
jgi:O-antigen ligase